MEGEKTKQKSKHNSLTIKLKYDNLWDKELHIHKQTMN